MSTAYALLDKRGGRISAYLKQSTTLFTQDTLFVYPSGYNPGIFAVLSTRSYILSTNGVLDELNQFVCNEKENNDIAKMGAICKKIRQST